MQRQPHHLWTPADVLHLRWYAKRGFSQAEAAKVMGRSYGSVINKAHQLGIHFDGPDGAPFLNRNGASTWRVGRMTRAEAWRAELRRIVNE
jgi:hypothetical protein